MWWTWRRDTYLLALHPNSSQTDASKRLPSNFFPISLSSLSHYKAKVSYSTFNSSLHAHRIAGTKPLLPCPFTIFSVSILSVRCELCYSSLVVFFPIPVDPVVFFCDNLSAATEKVTHHDDIRWVCRFFVGLKTGDNRWGCIQSKSLYYVSRMYKPSHMGADRSKNALCRHLIWEICFLLHIMQSDQECRRHNSWGCPKDDASI